jgi:hypothetical protein
VGIENYVSAVGFGMKTTYSAPPFTPVETRELEHWAAARALPRSEI